MKWMLCLIVLTSSLAMGQTCGGEGQPICEFAPATRQGASGCQTGEFLDIGTAQCWSCPAGYDRTLAAVTASDACAKTIAVQPYTATKNATVACQSGEFLDIGRNECWSCPSGYDRTLDPVTAATACSIAVPENVSSATFIGSGSGFFGTDCPSGAFFDLINGGTCWSCPSGSVRTANAVNSNSACVVAAHTETSSATFKRSHTCAAGQIYDAIDGGSCWTCPSGTNRTVFAVNSADACEAPAKTLQSVATEKRDYPCPAGQISDLIDGGTCWTCPAHHNRSIWPIDNSMACTIDASLTCNAGLTNIGGTCRVKDACGGENQRPCTILERIPSCDAKLYEDFKVNKCLPIKDGESPFLAGLGSLAKTIFDVRAICEDAVGLFPVIQTGNLNLDGTATCAREFGIGFLCATTTLAPDLSQGANASKAISNYYQTPPCSVPYTESLSPATRHGNSRLLSCPAGQFFDLIDTGSCWSCPDGWQRTLYPVNTQMACSRGDGVPELFRGVCAVGEFVQDAVVSPLKCLDALFKDGFPIVNGGASGVETVGKMCNLTGEFTLDYTAKLLLGAASIEDPVARRKRLMDQLTAIQTGLNSTSLVDRILNEPSCKGFLTGNSDSSTSIAKRRGAEFAVSSMGRGGLKIDLPEELDLRGDLRRLDGSSVRTVNAPGISLPQGTLRSGVYIISLVGRSGANPKAKSYLVTIQ